MKTFSCFRRDRRRHPVAHVRVRRAAPLQLHRVPLPGVQVSSPTAIMIASIVHGTGSEVPYEWFIDLCISKRQLGKETYDDAMTNFY